jgi:5'-deoxynucleotidase YfbR-like HD superfamily hydrolase
MKNVRFMNRVLLCRARLLLCIACAIVVGGAVQAKENRGKADGASQSQIVASFLAPLNINISAEWQKYLAEGVGKLDATGVSIAHKYLVTVVKALDTADHEGYILLIAEHFRNDYRQHKKQTPEHKVAIVMPQMEKYMQSASGVFENIRTEIIDTYTKEIEAIQKSTQQRLARAGAGRGSNVAQVQAQARQRARPVNSAPTITQVASDRAAVINKERKHFDNINERANTIDRKLASMEQSIEYYKNRIAQLESLQKQPSPPRSLPVRQAWVESFAAPVVAPAPPKQGREDLQLKEIQRIAQKSEQRLTAIENRVSKDEKELVKIDNDIQKVASAVASSANAKPQYTQPKYVRPRYVQPERKQVVSVNNKPSAVRATQASTPSASSVAPAPTAPTTVANTPAKPRTAYNAYRPVNNKVSDVCVIEQCTAVEDWLMNWYEQYQQYPEEKKRTSQFLPALKSTKDTYDAQKASYPKKLKFLFRRFDLLPYGI